MRVGRAVVDLHRWFTFFVTYFSTTACGSLPHDIFVLKRPKGPRTAENSSAHNGISMALEPQDAFPTVLVCSRRTVRGGGITDEGMQGVYVDI